MRITGGEWRGRSLKTTEGPGYRPAMSKVRHALFSMLEARGVYWPETRVLDVFAGSGSLGFEALSRGALHVTAIESARNAAKLIEENAARFGLEPGRMDVRCAPAREVLGKRCPAGYNVVFIDPPYGKDMLTPSLTSLLRNGWLADGGIVNAELEDRARLDPETIHPELVCVADRTYGQTRVVLWSR